MQLCIFLGTFAFIFYCVMTNSDMYFFEVIAYNDRERYILYELSVAEDWANFLNGITKEAALPMHVVVPSYYKKRFEMTLFENGIQHSSNELDVEDVHSIRSTSDDNNFTSRFHDYNEVAVWLNDSVNVNSINVKKIVIGKTLEERELIVMRLSKKNNKYSIFILGGEDGRDWLPPAIILDTIDDILEKRGLLYPLTDSYDFHFMPINNPDGYEYSRKYDRFWVKNRREMPAKQFCKGTTGIGVNINRNWFLGNRIDEPCNSINFGPTSLSEVESYKLAMYLNQIATKLMVFINLRGFGRFITMPYGHIPTPANNFRILTEILESAGENKLDLIYETAQYLLYNYTGGCADWVKKELNVPIVYTFYTRHIDNILPKETDIKLQSYEFSLMVKNIMKLSQAIYGPLFNSQNKLVLFISCKCLLMLSVSIIN